MKLVLIVINLVLIVALLISVTIASFIGIQELTEDVQTIRSCACQCMEL